MVGLGVTPYLLLHLFLNSQLQSAPSLGSQCNLYTEPLSQPLSQPLRADVQHGALSCTAVSSLQCPTAASQQHSLPAMLQSKQPGGQLAVSNQL